MLAWKNAQDSWIYSPIGRRDSMILTFNVPLDSGEGLCDIDTVQSYSKNIKKWEVLAQPN